MYQRAVHLRKPTHPSNTPWSAPCSQRDLVTREFKSNCDKMSVAECVRKATITELESDYLSPLDTKHYLEKSILQYNVSKFAKTLLYCNTATQNNFYESKNLGHY